MDTITISDLEVFYRVGVPDEERAQPQRLLLTVEMFNDFTAAGLTDDLAHTIDYYAVSRSLLGFGEGREWRLIEKLAADIVNHIFREFRPREVCVEVKKFVIPEACHVSVKLCRARLEA